MIFFFVIGSIGELVLVEKYDFVFVGGGIVTYNPSTFPEGVGTVPDSDTMSDLLTLERVGIPMDSSGESVGRMRHACASSIGFGMFMRDDIEGSFRI